MLERSDLLGENEDSGITFISKSRIYKRMEDLFGEAKVQAQMDKINVDLNTLREEKTKMEENPNIYVRYMNLNTRKQYRLNKKVLNRTLLLDKLQKEQDPIKREVLLKEI